MHTRSVETFPFEDMAQMSTTSCTGNFDPSHAKCLVLMPAHGSGNGCVSKLASVRAYTSSREIHTVKECRPTASALIQAPREHTLYGLQ